MSKEQTYLDSLKKQYNIKGGKPDKVQNTVGQKNLKIDKVGKLHKANKAVKMRLIKEHVENSIGHKIDRANSQREARRAKRRK